MPPRKLIKRLLFVVVLFYSIFQCYCFATSALKIVLTGGPCVGKTTLLQALKNQGFNTMPETARELIARAKKTGNASPAHNQTLVEQFQKDLWHLQVDKERNLPSSTITFLDRGLIDGLAFCTYYHIQPPVGLIDDIKRTIYDLVFLLDSLEPYMVYKNPPMAQQLHNLIIQAYQQYGYVLDKTLIRVPAFLYDEHNRYLRLEDSVQKRVAFMLDKIETYGLTTTGQCPPDNSC